MRYFLMAMLVSACAIVRPLGAQAPSTPAGQSSPHSKTLPLTLTGCVKKDDDGKNRFTLADEAKHDVYELSGAVLQPYVGKRVQVKGDSPNRLHIGGGMYPTANVAAQAGAIDPEQAAIAAMPGGGPRGTGSNQAFEFKVARVQTLKGSCE